MSMKTIFFLGWGEFPLPHHNQNHLCLLNSYYLSILVHMIWSDKVLVQFMMTVLTLETLQEKE